MKNPTYHEAVAIANSAGRDAGNRSARNAGRIIWSLDDLRAGAKVCKEVLESLGFPPPDDETTRYLAIS